MVEIGEVFEPACLAVVGDDLPGFLLGWPVYHLLACAQDVDLTDAVAARDLP